MSACRKLLCATRAGASRTWRGLPVTPKILRVMDRLNSELFPEEKIAQTT